MVPTADPSQLASRARRLYVDEVIKGLPHVVQRLYDAARLTLEKPTGFESTQRRRDLIQSLQKSGRAWLAALSDGLRNVLAHGMAATLTDSLPPRSPGLKGMTLMDDDAVDREILTSRLALAIMDRASWEFSDLRSRIAILERRQELDTHDPVRAHVLARLALEAWRQCGLGSEGWREIQPVLHDEFSLLVEEAYHETNRWLIEQQVMPEVDLRPFIRRSRGAPSPTGAGPLDPLQRAATLSSRAGATMSSGAAGSRVPVHHTVSDETRLLTRSGPLPRGGSEHAEEVLGRLNRLVGRHLPGFGDTARGPVTLTPRLSRAIDEAQQGMRERLAPPAAGPVLITTPMLLDEVHQRSQALKRAAETPTERATIEIVAMMFQSILAEERIPAQLRVWFARLQMPVLRVAVAEPDFFATIDHPARRLIDRMGACVMGFDDTTRPVGDALEKEVKRIVQVVEAYPDTGRRVFQTVLTEFEKFIEHFFSSQNEVSRRGVSLAQQVEQREALAIQYTIELRKMLDEVPVQEGIRQFLFHVWADVLATTAVRFGGQGDQLRTMKKAAADLIWSASAKVSREERAEVIRHLPQLLKLLREGMAAAGIAAERQDEQIQILNNSLAAAFTAKAAAIPTDRLGELMERLEALEELLPDASNVEVDESVMLDLSGHESSELEVVSDGGSMPSPAMLAWARELMVGSWYMLEHRGRTEAVQLAWHGLRRQLSLFVSPAGRCVLFQHYRLGSYLQAGLLLPAQDESLTVRATRSALAKLDADPARLLR